MFKYQYAFMWNGDKTSEISEIGNNMINIIGKAPSFNEAAADIANARIEKIIKKQGWFIGLLTAMTYGVDNIMLRNKKVEK